MLKSAQEVVDSLCRFEYYSTEARIIEANNAYHLRPTIDVFMSVDFQANCLQRLVWVLRLAKKSAPSMKTSVIPKS